METVYKVIKTHAFDKDIRYETIGVFADRSDALDVCEQLYPGELARQYSSVKIEDITVVTDLQDWAKNLKPGSHLAKKFRTKVDPDYATFERLKTQFES